MNTNEKKKSTFILLTTNQVRQRKQLRSFSLARFILQKKKPTFIPLFTALCKTLPARDRCFTEPSRAFEKYADASEFQGRQEAAGSRR